MTTKKGPELQYLSQVKQEDLRQHHLEILEMLKTQIEAGNVESLVVIFCGDKPNDRTSFGGRHLIRARHMDFLEDAFNGVMQQVTDETGCTAQRMREARAEAFERMKRETQ